MNAEPQFHFLSLRHARQNPTIRDIPSFALNGAGAYQPTHANIGAARTFERFGGFGEPMRSVGEAGNYIASTLMPVADVKTVPLAQADYHCDPTAGIPPAPSNARLNI